MAVLPELEDVKLRVQNLEIVPELVDLLLGHRESLLVRVVELDAVLLHLELLDFLHHLLLLVQGHAVVGNLVLHPLNLAQELLLGLALQVPADVLHRADLLLLNLELLPVRSELPDLFARRRGARLQLLPRRVRPLKGALLLDPLHSYDRVQCDHLLVQAVELGLQSSQLGVVHVHPRDANDPHALGLLGFLLAALLLLALRARGSLGVGRGVRLHGLGRRCLSVLLQIDQSLLPLLLGGLLERLCGHLGARKSLCPGASCGGEIPSGQPATGVLLSGSGVGFAKTRKLAFLSVRLPTKPSAQGSRSAALKVESPFVSLFLQDLAQL